MEIESILNDIEKEMKEKEKQKRDEIGERMLESIMQLSQKIESMDEKIGSIDRNNKKFLMAAGMKKTELLENELLSQKKKIIQLLDQIDTLSIAIQTSKADDLKHGLTSFYHKVAELISDLGLEEIEARKNIPFNSKEHECVEVVHKKEYGDNVIVELRRRGYRDKNSKMVLRYAQVAVNKLEER